MTVAPLDEATRSPLDATRARSAGTVALSLLGLLVWTYVIRKVLYAQPLYAYLPLLRDLSEHLRDAQILLHGGDPYVLRAHLNDTTPPLVALLHHPLSWVPAQQRSAVVIFADLLALSAALAAGLRVLLRRSVTACFLAMALVGAPLTVLVLSQAAYSGLWWGQDQIIAMAMVVIDLLLVPPRWRGLLIGLAAGLLLAPAIFALLLIRPKPAAILRAALAFVGTALLAALANLHASAVYWFHLLPSGEAVHRVVITGVARPGNASLEALASRAPFHGGSVGVVHWLLVAVVAAAGILAAWRAQSSGLVVTAVSFLGLTSAALSPVSWDHHWIWAALLPLAAIELWRSQRALAIGCLVAVAIAFLRGYPLVRFLPTSQPELANLVHSMPSIVTAVLVVWLAIALRPGSGEPS